MVEQNILTQPPFPSPESLQDVRNICDDLGFETQKLTFMNQRKITCLLPIINFSIFNKYYNHVNNDVDINLKV